MDHRRERRPQPSTWARPTRRSPARRPWPTSDRRRPGRARSLPARRPRTDSPATSTDRLPVLQRQARPRPPHAQGRAAALPRPDPTDPEEPELDEPRLHGHRPTPPRPRGQGEDSSTSPASRPRSSSGRTRTHGDDRRAHAAGWRQRREVVRLVEQLSNKMILHLGSHVLDRSSARASSTSSTPSAARPALHAHGPYRELLRTTSTSVISRDVLRHFHGGRCPRASTAPPRRPLHRHLPRERRRAHAPAAAAIAHAAGKAYELVTCAETPARASRPARVPCNRRLRGAEFPRCTRSPALPEAPAPLLRGAYNPPAHRHPGIRGLAALGIARILRLPVAATYHRSRNMPRPSPTTPMSRTSRSSCSVL